MRITKRIRRYAILAVVGFGILFGITFAMNYTQGSDKDIGISSCSIGGASGPAGVVEATIGQIPSRDIEAVVINFAPQARVIMQQRLLSLYTKCDKIEVINVRVLLVYEQGLNARVQANWDEVQYKGSQSAIDSRSKLVKLVKNDDYWLINEAF